MNKLFSLNTKSIRQLSNIKPHRIMAMLMSKDSKNRPQMAVVYDSDIYHFPLCDGWQIHCCNEFLRSLDTNIEIEFNTYRQYAELIENVFQNIKR